MKLEQKEILEAKTRHSFQKTFTLAGMVFCLLKNLNIQICPSMWNYVKKFFKAWK